MADSDKNGSLVFMRMPANHKPFVDEPPIDPVRVVILILAVAFFAFVAWVLTRPGEDSSSEPAIRGAVGSSMAVSGGLR